MIHSIPTQETENKAKTQVRPPVARAKSFGPGSYRNRFLVSLARLSAGSAGTANLLPGFVGKESPRFNDSSDKKKTPCGCKGGCSSCGGKAAAFYGDLDEPVEKQAPDGGSGAVGPADAGSGAKPVDKPDAGVKAPSCSDICDRAYKDNSLNDGGGGVVCDGATKCACAFDVPPLTRGQCPDFDAIVIKHETNHVVDNNSECDPRKGLHRAKVKDTSKLTQTECTHRKQSIKDIDAALPKATGPCKTGMESIRGLLDTWVKANC